MHFKAEQLGYNFEHEDVHLKCEIQLIGKMQENFQSLIKQRSQQKFFFKLESKMQIERKEVLSF